MELKINSLIYLILGCVLIVGVCLIVTDDTYLNLDIEGTVTQLKTYHGKYYLTVSYKIDNVVHVKTFRVSSDKYYTNESIYLKVSKNDYSDVKINYNFPFYGFLMISSVLFVSFIYLVYFYLSS